MLSATFAVVILSRALGVSNWQSIVRFLGVRFSICVGRVSSARYGFIDLEPDNFAYWDFALLSGQF